MTLVGPTGHCGCPHTFICFELSLSPNALAFLKLPSSLANFSCPQLGANERFSGAEIDENGVAYPHFASPCV